MSVSVRRDPTVGSETALNIEFSSPLRRSVRSIAALNGDRSRDTPTDPGTVGLATIAARVREIGGSIQVEDHEDGTIITIRMSIRHAIEADDHVVGKQADLSRQA
jgi:signal transduction histidine kinase